MTKQTKKIGADELDFILQSYTSWFINSAIAYLLIAFGVGGIVGFIIGRYL